MLRDERGPELDWQLDFSYGLVCCGSHLIYVSTANPTDLQVASEMGRIVRNMYEYAYFT